MAQYLPQHRPGDTVTFDVTADVTGGTPVQVGTADRSVAPATAGTTTFVGIAGHDAKVGDKVTVEVGKPIHLLVASGTIARGTKVEAAAGGRVRALAAESTGSFGMALTSATDGAPVQVLQA